MDRLNKALLILFVLRPLMAQLERLDAEIAALCEERDQLARKTAAAEFLLLNWAKN